MYQALGGAWGAAAALGWVGLAARLHRGTARRWIVLLGLPLAVAVQALAWPAWVWLVLAAGLLALYPPQRWGEAPLFLTPTAALQGLKGRIALSAGDRVLDAGCGTGAGLQALRAVFPEASFEGVEASRALVWWTRWRCPWARVSRADLWAHPWASYRLVYVFLRPESMAGVLEKARAELAPGTVLVSLDFALPGVAPTFEGPAGGRHHLYVYRAEALN